MKLPLLLTATAGLGLLITNAFAQAPPHDGPASHSLEFIENKGQWDVHARFAAALPGGRLFAEADGLTFSLLAGGGPAQLDHGSKRPAPTPAADSLLRGHAFTLHFEGAAPATITTESPTAEHRNYFLGNDAKHWASDVRSFRALHYAGLWPGVSARVYESADQHLEYDFELAPGAKPAAIGLRHDGADGLALDATGNLLVKTSVGTVTERAPQAWQTDASGRRRPVACRYVLDGQVARFALGPYDAKRPLTIDPVVVFATYTGSTADNWGFTATYDAQGNLYSGGIVFSVGYPATTGAFQTRFAGLIDIGIIKYNTSANGPSARVWATYLGGASADFPASLVVNSLGELLVLGTTSSNTYPVTATALQGRFAGGTNADPYGYGTGYGLPNGSDLVITRLNAAGSGLVGSTYLGGPGNDGLLPLNPNTTAQLAHNYGDPFRGDILVDAADNVYVASNTTSTTFPLTGATFNNQYRGGTTDGLVFKLNPGLTAMLWGGLLGGTASDAAYSIQVAPGSGDIYVAGGTLSANFPTTTGSLHPTRLGDVDGFAARISASGTSITRATYLGTTSYDQGYFLQLGTDGGVYVLGQTAGAYPTTPGLYTTPNGRQFIHKLDADLSTTQLATVFGSGRTTIDIDPTAFLVDRCDRVYVCGWGGFLNQGYGSEPYLNLNGTTAGLPVTPGAVQPTTDANDFYLAQFSAGLSSLAYATYYGANGGSGDHVDGGTARFDPRGVVYQAVCSCGAGSGFPVPPGAHTYSTINPSANCNNAAFVFNFEPSIANAGNDQTVCATAGPQALAGSPDGGLWSGPGVTGSAATGFVFTPSVALLGVQTLTYTVLSTGLCTTTGTRRITVTAPPTVTFALLAQTSYCLPSAGSPALSTVRLTGTPAGGTFSGPGVSGNVASGFVFAPGTVSLGTFQLVYSLTVGGCTAQAAQTVTISNAANAGADQAVCATAGPQTLVGSPSGGQWSGPGVTGSPATGFVFTPAVALAGMNTLTYTVGSNCSGTRRIAVTAPPAVSFAASPQAIYCLPVPGAPALPAVPLAGSPAGGTFSGPGVSGSTATGFVFSPNLAPGTVQLVYSVVSGSCTVQATQAVTIVLPPAPTLAPDTLLCIGSTQPFALRGSPAGGTFSGPGVSGSALTGFVFTPAANFAGSVSVVYSVSNGNCAATATRRISVAPVPPLTASWTPAACPETRLAPLTLRFTVASPLTSNFIAQTTVWDFGDGTQSTAVNPTHTYAGPGRYQPRVRVRYNADRCETQLSAPPVEVVEHKVPNIITPNGDKQNETFRLGPDCVARLQVFSRWGQQVFESAAYHDEWDANGQPDGVYYYLLTYADGHRVKGWVEVVR